jgi:hypothetical protein
LSRCKECKEDSVSSSEKRSVKEKTLTELLNTLKAQQGVLERKLPRGHLYPFEEQKGQRPLRSERLKLNSTRKERRENLFQVQEAQKRYDPKRSFKRQWLSYFA